MVHFQLSNLSEGVYTFVLKVTDSSGQFSTAEVHVFVKPPTNNPPVAKAGKHQVSVETVIYSFSSVNMYFNEFFFSIYLYL